MLHQRVGQAPTALFGMVIKGLDHIKYAHLVSTYASKEEISTVSLFRTQAVELTTILHSLYYGEFTEQTLYSISFDLTQSIILL